MSPLKPGEFIGDLELRENAFIFSYVGKIYMENGVPIMIAINSDGKPIYGLQYVKLVENVFGKVVACQDYGHSFGFCE